MSSSNKLKVIIIIIIINLFLLINNKIRILLFGIVLILLILFIFNYYKKTYYEAMENMDGSIIDSDKHSRMNPLYNVMVTDYQDNVNKPEASKHYDISKEKLINDNVKNFILENNKDNQDIGNIFKDVVNNLDFEKSMRQFHMNPSTTIPNNQDDFLKYCYSDLYSEKPLLIY